MRESLSQRLSPYHADPRQPTQLCKWIGQTAKPVASCFLKAKSALHIVYTEPRDDRIVGGSCYDRNGSWPANDRAVLTKLTR